MERKPMHLKLKKGALHSALGIPQGKKIPASKETVKSTDTPLMKKRKVFAQNAKKRHHGGTKAKVAKIMSKNK